MATFREEDVAAGRAVSGRWRLRQRVSKASGGVWPEPPLAAANQEGEPLRKATPGALAAEGATAQPLAVDEMLFSDRSYVLGELPDALQGAHFLRVNLSGQKRIRCTRAGAVYFLTPAPNRNRDSMTQTLLDQGFKKVALPEVRCSTAPARPTSARSIRRTAPWATRSRWTSGPCRCSFRRLRHDRAGCRLGTTARECLILGHESATGTHLYHPPQPAPRHYRQLGK